MRLQERAWVSAEGLGPQWRTVSQARAEETLRRLKSAEKGFASAAPKAVASYGYRAGMRLVLDRATAFRRRILGDPGLDYWLSLWDKHFSLPCRPADWHLQMSAFQGFATTLALSSKASFETEAVWDPDARFCLYGSPFFVQAPREQAGRPVKIAVRAGRLTFSGRELELKRVPEIGKLTVEHERWLFVHGVTMHGLARPSAAESERFCGVLRAALEQMAEIAPAMHAELTDMVRAVSPLLNAQNFSSVSSSYVNMRGLICLSHSDDPLLQAETLIHEFCHQKMNQLLSADPVLLPGQGGQVFYSPWRKDARRLRGLLLGAHAFLNVADYLDKAGARSPLKGEAAVELMLGTAARLYQVEEALRTLSFYASFTEFGRRFMLEMWRELGGLFHAAQRYPPSVMEEARRRARTHREKHALFQTGFHRAEDFVDGIKHAPYSPAEPAA